MTQLLGTPGARLAARNARRQAGARGHNLDRFRREMGRPAAVCGCGVYVFVDRDNGGSYWGFGRLSVNGQANWDRCSITQEQPS
jgi:hypothetical protein